MAVRDPEHQDHFWVNPWGVPYSEIRVSDLVRVDRKGNVIEGNYEVVNPSLFTIEANILKARPDVVGIVHSHAIHGRTWSSLGRLLEPLTQEACILFNDQAIFDGYAKENFPPRGRLIAKALAGKNALILKNHGLLTVGNSIDEAAWRMISMERSCQSQLLAEAAGIPCSIPDEIATWTNEISTSTSESKTGFTISPLWASFQSLYRWAVKEQPDFLIDS